jgi:hypothetical protein
MFERSPEIVAMDWSGQYECVDCGGRHKPLGILSVTIDSLLLSSF